MSSGTPLLAVRDLVKTFAGRGLGAHRSLTYAVNDVTLDIQPGETLGLVGESGSGKTTLGRTVVRLEEPTSGRIELDGADVTSLRGQDVVRYHREVQMIFQNTQDSFNPNRRVRSILADPFRIHGLAKGNELDDRIAELLTSVGLSPDMARRYPRQFSSGQRQRLGIARALAVEPRLVVADEPVSALDVSVQAQVLNLFATLRRQLGLTMLFISHDLRAVYFLCERIAVLYLGHLVELAPRRVLLERAAHPYTRALVASAPAFRPGAGLTRDIIRGEVGDMASAAAAGCPFAPRCKLRQELGAPRRCVDERPLLRPVPGGGQAACHYARESAPDDGQALVEMTAEASSEQY